MHYCFLHPGLRISSFSILQRAANLVQVLKKQKLHSCLPRKVAQTLTSQNLRFADRLNPLRLLRENLHGIQALNKQD